MSSGVEFARLGRTRILWRPHDEWPLVAVEAIDPAAPVNGPVDWVSWKGASPSGSSARAYVYRAYSARYDTAAKITVLDLAAWQGAVEEAKRLYERAIRPAPKFIWSRRTKDAIDVEAAVLPQGIVFSSKYRVGVLSWGCFDEFERYSPGSTYVMLRTIVPGLEFEYDSEGFYRIVSQLRRKV